MSVFVVIPFGRTFTVPGFMALFVAFLLMVRIGVIVTLGMIMSVALFLTGLAHVAGQRLRFAIAAGSECQYHQSDRDGF